MKKLIHIPLFLSIAFLSSCGNTQPTPTLDIGGTFTAVAKTMSASFPTSTTPPLPTQTSTPAPTSAPIAIPTQSNPGQLTNASFSPPVQTGSTCDNATFVSDVTIEDGTEI